MILALALLQAGHLFQAQISADESRDEVSLCAAAPIPKLGYHDLELLQVGVGALPKGSANYSPSSIAQVTDGRGVECRIVGDTVLISLTVNKALVASGVSVLSGILMSPALEDEDLQSSLTRLQQARPDYWSIGMNPAKFDLKDAPRDAVLEVVHRVFDPRRVIVAFGGAARADVAEQSWTQSTRDWTPAPDPNLPDDSPTVSIATLPGRVGIADFVSEPGPLTPPRFLALYALGWGKRSALFRIARDGHGWSYRQETYAIPSEGGWTCRMFMPMADATDLPGRLETLRKELQDDADAWTEDDRQRALGMAEANLVRKLPYGPLVPSVEDDLEGEVSAEAFWHLKTGADWDPEVLQRQMGGVTLEELKSAAKSLLKESHTLVIPASG